MISCDTVPYGFNCFQNLLSMPVHLGVAIGHLSFPLLFFPDQVTYPGRIRPRLCTLHSFLTSFLFSMPGGSWTVSPLACKCICASCVQWSMSIWMFLFLPSLSFLFPALYGACLLSWPCGALLNGAQVARFFFLNWGKSRVCSFFFHFCFSLLSRPHPSFLSFPLAQI